MRHLLLALLFSTLLLSSTSCKKEDPAEVDGVSSINGLPYYYFTESDKRWFGASSGAVWTFENASGNQRRYKVTVQQNRQIENKILVRGMLSDSYKLVSYSDEAVVALANVDATSSDSGGRFEFYTDPTVAAAAASAPNRLRAEANWFAFLGTEQCIPDYYSPKDNQLTGPFQQLSSRGTSYFEAALFSVSPRGLGYPAPLPSSLYALYYDHQHGLIRLLSRDGEVWDRVF